MPVNNYSDVNIKMLLYQNIEFEYLTEQINSLIIRIFFDKFPKKIPPNTARKTTVEKGMKKTIDILTYQSSLSVVIIKVYSTYLLFKASAIYIYRALIFYVTSHGLIFSVICVHFYWNWFG